MSLSEQELVEKIDARYGKQVAFMRKLALEFPWQGRSPIAQRHKLQVDSYLDWGDLVVSILLTFDKGPHSSGWWRNSEYNQCWHVSIVGIRPPESRLLVNQTPKFEEVPQAERRAWCRVIFGDEDVKKAWNEPPASALDAYRDAPASSSTWHTRVFVDRDGHSIIPQGEVYSLVPWDDGSSPEKVFR